MHGQRFFYTVGLICLLLGQTSDLTGQSETGRTGSPEKIDVPGLDNVFRVSAKLYSGSGPHDPENFAELKKLGIRTVLSVDGTRPDVAAARAHGLRYVHIPIGYHGISHEQALRIAQAATVLPGPIYVHCHHGKHRGPAAAAVVELCLDENCTAGQAVQLLQLAGTDPKYKGLYQSVRSFQPPTAAELAKLPSDIPEVAPLPALTEAMVAVDETFDHIKLIRTAGWKTPADHAFLAPAHEALQLLEHYRELQRRPELQQRPADFRQWLQDALQSAEGLEQTLLAAEKSGKQDNAAIEKLYQQSAACCTRCHAKYRDNR